MLPSTGTLSHWSPPQGPGIRVDSGVAAGSTVTHYYDPMLAKLIAFGSDRSSAIARLRLALQAFAVDGVRTNVPLLLWIARDEAFARGDTTTRFLDERLDESIFAPGAPPGESVLLAVAALLADRRTPWRIAGAGIPIRLQHAGGTSAFVADAAADARHWLLSGDRSGELGAERRADVVHAALDGNATSGIVTYGGRTIDVHLDGRIWPFAFEGPPEVGLAGGGHGAAGAAHVTAPMPGRIAKIAIGDGDAVDEHALLVVLEAMKMEHRIEAPAAATVKAVLVKEGQIVAGGTPLVELGS
jgi:3-methylcrotonyl-CoA carboxylase alpha subunit